MKEFYTFTPTIFHACHPARPAVESWRVQISETIVLPIQSGRTIDANQRDGLRVDVSYPEGCEKAKRLLQDEESETETA